MLTVVARARRRMSVIVFQGKTPPELDCDSLGNKT